MSDFNYYDYEPSNGNGDLGEVVDDSGINEGEGIGNE